MRGERYIRLCVCACVVVACVFMNLCFSNMPFKIKPCKTVILAGESRSSICVDVDAKPRSGCSSGNIIIKMIGHDNCQDDDL